MPISQDPSLWESICLWDISDKIAFANCILTGLFLIATVISVFYAFKAYRHQKDRSRKEAACALAKRYAEDIIRHYGFVTDVLEQTELGSKTKKLFPYDDLVEFTQDEAKSLLQKQNVSYEEIESVFMQPDPKSILHVMLLHTHSNQEREELLQAYGGLLQGEENKKQLSGIFLRNEFLDEVSGYLNVIEWFSMNCRYGIADEELLYQSLHQSFLSSVWQLYFYICEINVANEDQYYTNIIWLFNQWRERLKKIQKEATDRQSEAKRKIEEAEDKLKKAKPKIYSGRPLK